MTVSRRKGNPGKADMLFSRIIRSRGYCERCMVAGVPFDTAHIVRRRYSRTRCLEANAWCLCRSCHRTVDEWPGFHQELVERTIGLEMYEALVRDAQDGIPVSSALFWKAEVERLTQRCIELELPTTWRAA